MLRVEDQVRSAMYLVTAVSMAGQILVSSKTRLISFMPGFLLLWGIGSIVISITGLWSMFWRFRVMTKYYLYGYLLSASVFIGHTIASLVTISNSKASLLETCRANMLGDCDAVISTYVSGIVGVGSGSIAIAALFASVGAAYLVLENRIHQSLSTRKEEQPSDSIRPSYEAIKKRLRKSSQLERPSQDSGFDEVSRISQSRIREYGCPRPHEQFFEQVYKEQQPHIISQQEPTMVLPPAASFGPSGQASQW